MQTLKQSIAWHWRVACVLRELERFCVPLFQRLGVHAARLGQLDQRILNQDHVAMFASFFLAGEDEHLDLFDLSQHDLDRLYVVH